MSKAGPELYTAICEHLMESPSMKRAARLSGIAESSIWRLLAESSQNPDKHRFDFGSFGEMPFHEAVLFCRNKIGAQKILEYAMQEATGAEEKIFFQGRPQWVEDEKLSTMSDDELKALGIPDRWLRVKNPITGIMERVQHTQKRAANPALLGTLLKAYMPQMFGDKREVSVNLSGGVRHLVQSEPKPKAIPAPVREAVEQVVHEQIIDQSEPEDDAMPEQTIEDEPEELNGSGQPVEPTATPPTVAAQLLADPSPPRAPRHSETARAQWEAILRAKQERDAAGVSQTKPEGHVMVYKADDEPKRSKPVNLPGIGPGHVPPGGTKVV